MSEIRKRAWNSCSNRRSIGRFVLRCQALVPFRSFFQGLPLQLVEATPHLANMLSSSGQRGNLHGTTQLLESVTRPILCLTVPQLYNKKPKQTKSSSLNRPFKRNSQIKPLDQYSEGRSPPSRHHKGGRAKHLNQPLKESTRKKQKGKSKKILNTTVNIVVFSKAENLESPRIWTPWRLFFLLNSTIVGTVPKMNNKQKKSGQWKTYRSKNCVLSNKRKYVGSKPENDVENSEE